MHIAWHEQQAGLVMVTAEGEQPFHVIATVRRVGEHNVVRRVCTCCHCRVEVFVPAVTSTACAQQTVEPLRVAVLDHVSVLSTSGQVAHIICGGFARSRQYVQTDQKGEAKHAQTMCAWNGGYTCCTRL